MKHISEYQYLSKYYTDMQLMLYANGSIEKLQKLYDSCQPKKVKIASLLGKTDDSTVLVNSPDGWVPVTDCVEKIKKELYSFTFASGITITASHDHLYQKPDLSWQYAKDLAVADMLLSKSRKPTKNIRLLALKHLNLSFNKID